MPVTETIDVKQLGPYLNGILDTMGLKDPKKTLAACAVAVKNELKKMLQAGTSPDGAPYKPLAHPRPNGKSQPLWDTGALVRSLGAGVNHVEKIDKASLEVGTNMEYAATHQYGAVIRPKKGKFLAIPLTMPAKKAGSPRNFGAPLKAVIGKKGGVLIGAAPRKSKGRMVLGKMMAQYALVREVTIPPRPFVGWSAKMEADVTAILVKDATAV